MAGLYKHPDSLPRLLHHSYNVWTSSAGGTLRWLRAPPYLRAAATAAALRPDQTPAASETRLSARVNAHQRRPAPGFRVCRGSFPPQLPPHKYQSKVGVKTRARRIAPRRKMRRFWSRKRAQAARGGRHNKRRKKSEGGAQSEAAFSLSRWSGKKKVSEDSQNVSFQIFLNLGQLLWKARLIL